MNHPTTTGDRRSGRRGQSMVEFAMIVSVVMLLLLGMLEFGFVFDHHLSLEYATREGARVGAALANGGGAMGCGSGQSPNAATVDQTIVAAVQRILKSPGSPIIEANINEIRIYKSDTNGDQTGSSANVWTYTPAAGPVVDGAALDFSQSGGTGWAACSRDNGATPDSIGVSLSYTYHLVTPLGGFANLFGGGSNPSIPISDRTVMALNPS